jgi:tRNA pseudouridine55 synthase
MDGVRDGIILIDKEEGKSSFGVVRDVREILKEKKVGHAGTLDPFATGLLVVMLGQGTKLFPFLTGVDKDYEAVLRLGVVTDTLDATGRVVRTEEVVPLDPAIIREEASCLVGEIEQVPPAFSAVHCDGKRAYALARKGFSPVLEKRRVRVHRLEITDVRLPDIAFTVRCSKGTYVRSLASDLGERLGPGAHLISLRRVGSGPFRVEDAVGSRDVSSFPDLKGRVIPLPQALPHMKEVEVSDGTCAMVQRGVPAQRWADEILSGLPEGSDPVKLVNEGRLLAILKPHPHSSAGRDRLEVMRVFV